jgi:hypothetical protein
LRQLLNEKELPSLLFFFHCESNRLIVFTSMARSRGRKKDVSMMAIPAIMSRYFYVISISRPCKQRGSRVPCELTALPDDWQPLCTNLRCCDLQHSIVVAGSSWRKVFGDYDYLYKVLVGIWFPRKSKSLPTLWHFRKYPHFRQVVNPPFCNVSNGWWR